MRLVNFAGFSGLRLALTCLLFTLGRACLDVLVVHFGELSGLALALTFLLFTLGGGEGVLFSGLR